MTYIYLIYSIDDHGLAQPKGVCARTYDGTLWAHARRFLFTYETEILENIMERAVCPPDSKPWMTTQNAVGKYSGDLGVRGN